MNETTNYARHVGDNEKKKRGTGLTVFFGHEHPIPRDELSEWAFFALPEGQEWHLFRGRLVAEDSDQRAARLKMRHY